MAETTTYAGMQARSIAHERIRQERNGMIDCLDHWMLILETKANFLPDADATWIMRIVGEMQAQRTELQRRDNEARDDFRNGGGGEGDA